MAAAMENNGLNDSANGRFDDMMNSPCWLSLLITPGELNRQGVDFPGIFVMAPPRPHPAPI
jgi:hypothetical protein